MVGLGLGLGLSTALLTMTSVTHLGAVSSWYDRGTSWRTYHTETTRAATTQPGLRLCLVAFISSGFHLQCSGLFWV